MWFSLGHLSLLMFLLVSALEKSNYFRNSIYRECSLLGGFDFGKARVPSVDFALCHFDVGFRRCFGIMLQWFVDRFGIRIDKNKKATKHHQYDVDKRIRLAENDDCQFIWFYEQRIQDTHLEFISVGGFDFF
jgi:hypothetical protein